MNFEELEIGKWWKIDSWKLEKGRLKLENEKLETEKCWKMDSWEIEKEED